MSERDKALTEAMGEEYTCEHDYSGAQSGKVCTKCGFYRDYPMTGQQVKNDFSTWEGFGVLWEWAQKQDWWCEFYVYKLESLISVCGRHKMFDVCFINPDRFADAVYEFLKASHD